MAIPSINEFFQGLIPLVPGIGPLPSAGNSSKGSGNFFNPMPTPSDDLNGVTGGGGVSVSTSPYPVTSLNNSVGGDLKSGGWSGAHTVSGVVIEEKTVDGLTAFRATLNGLSTPPEKIVKAILDVKGYVGNVKYVKSIKVFSPLNNGRVVYGQYLNLGAAVVLANRLSTLELALTSWSDDEVICEWNLACDDGSCDATKQTWIDATKEAGDSWATLEPVYTPRNEGRWIYKKQADGTWSLTQELLVNAGGTIKQGSTEGAMAGNVSGMNNFAQQK